MKTIIKNQYFKNIDERENFIKTTKNQENLYENG